MAAKESRKRTRVDEQSSSGALEPAPDPFPNPLGDLDLGILPKQIDTLADAWVNAIMEEQAARSARSRRKVIEDFHCVCGW